MLRVSRVATLHINVEVRVERATFSEQGRNSARRRMPMKTRNRFSSDDGMLVYERLVQSARR